MSKSSPPPIANEEALVEKLLVVATKAATTAVANRFEGKLNEVIGFVNANDVKVAGDQDPAVLRLELRNKEKELFNEKDKRLEDVHKRLEEVKGMSTTHESQSHKNVMEMMLHQHKFAYKMAALINNTNQNKKRKRRDRRGAVDGDSGSTSASDDA